MSKQRKKSVTKFFARPGFQIIQTDKEATLVGSELTKLFPNGDFKPLEVVDAARSIQSPLHSYFEWDDKKAAEKHRLDQARDLIKAVVINVNGDFIPAWHSVRVSGSKGRSYVDFAQCRETEYLWEQVVKQALVEAEFWSERYKLYSELENIHESIKLTKEKLYGKNVSRSES